MKNNFINYKIIPFRQAPICTPDGFYAKLQYSNGVQYCSDRQGNPIESYLGRVSCV